MNRILTSKVINRQPPTCLSYSYRSIYNFGNNFKAQKIYNNTNLVGLLTLIGRIVQVKGYKMKKSITEFDVEKLGKENNCVKSQINIVNMRKYPSDFETSSIIEGLVNFHTISTVCMKVNNSQIVYNRIVSEEDIILLKNAEASFYLVKTKDEETSILIGELKQKIENTSMTEYFLKFYDELENKGEVGKCIWIPCFSVKNEETIESPVFSDNLLSLEVNGESERAVEKCENKLESLFSFDKDYSKAVHFERKKDDILVAGDFVIAVVNRSMLETGGVPAVLAYTVEKSMFVQV